MMFARRNRFWLLLLATVLVIAIASWLVTRKGAESESGSELWLPGLRGDLDRITRLRLTGADNKLLVTIERGTGGFVVVERDRYRADTTILRTLLLQMADARRVEAMTARSEKHSALGVESVASAQATGVRVEIEGATRPLSVTIGRTADQLGGGTFVRTDKEAQAWLVSGNIVIEREPQRWLEKRIVDISPARIERVDVQASDGEFALVRATSSAAKKATDPLGGDVPPGAGDEADGVAAASTDAFVIEGVPVIDMASTYAPAATAGGLSELDLLDVRSRGQAPAPTRGTTKLRFGLHNGVTVNAIAWVAEGKTRLQLHAEPTPSAQAPAPAAGVAEATPANAMVLDAGGNKEAALTARSSEISEKAVATAVAAFNRQWQHWTYTLPPHRSAGLTPTRLALLKPPEDS